MRVYRWVVAWIAALICGLLAMPLLMIPPLKAGFSAGWIAFRKKLKENPFT